MRFFDRDQPQPQCHLGTNPDARVERAEIALHHLGRVALRIDGHEQRPQLLALGAGRPQRLGEVELQARVLPRVASGELAARTWSGAWTPTVARLEDPVPSLGQHLRSWMPSGAATTCLRCWTRL